MAITPQSPGRELRDYSRHIRTESRRIVDAAKRTVARAEQALAASRSVTKRLAALLSQRRSSN